MLLFQDDYHVEEKAFVVDEVNNVIKEVSRVILELGNITRNITRNIMRNITRNITSRYEKYHITISLSFNLLITYHLIYQSIESTIQNAPYHQNKVGQWNSNIIEQALKKLTGLNKPFKYIVTCTIMQKNGAGLHSASSCYWDNSTDGIFYMFGRAF